MTSQVQELEAERDRESANADNMEAIKRENEELKEVLSAVQIDLENNQEVGMMATVVQACSFNSIHGSGSLMPFCNW